LAQGSEGLTGTLFFDLCAAMGELTFAQAFARVGGKLVDLATLLAQRSQYLLRRT